MADYPVEEWRKVVDLDLNGVFYGCKAVVPGMTARNTAASSMSPRSPAKEGNPNAAAYSAAKAG